MVERIWDKENKYTEGFLKEYQYWVLEVSYRQHTLGSYIIFAKRSIEKISELEIEELADLKKTMAEIEAALLKIETFKPDRFNYWQMGNYIHQLHFHGIPRYSSPRIFNKKEWIDKTYGARPIWAEKEVNHSVVKKINEEIQDHL